VKRVALIALGCALLAGCNGDGGEASATTQPTATDAPATTEAPATTNGGSKVALRLYFLQDGKLVATRREVLHTVAVGRAALAALAEGPTAAEQQKLGFTTACSGPALAGATLRIEDEEATTVPAFGGACGAQVGWTLLQFPTVRRVNGAERADLEQYAPQILVDSPAPFDIVSSPLRVIGTANTFEATFEYDLDVGGRTIAHHFVTATSGNGTRGTFDFQIAFDVDRLSDGELVVFESSAEDGSRINIRRIPLRLQPA
jgi:Immunoglobulin-like domain of bacterial spore germination